jgi:hypothetical protein
MRDDGDVGGLVGLRLPGVLAGHDLGRGGLGEADEAHLGPRLARGLGGGGGDGVVGAVGGIEGDENLGGSHGRTSVRVE